MTEIRNIDKIKALYFSGPEKIVYLKKGDTLLQHGQKNKKVYLIVKGILHGFQLEPDSDEEVAFEATKDQFIGIYSYFSENGASYATVKAATDATVAYYDIPFPLHSEQQTNEIQQLFFPHIVEELSYRQKYARRITKHRQREQEQLTKSEKMATLGQLAAGLAHELNNSIAVIDSNLQHCIDFTKDLISDTRKNKFLVYFLKGLNEGQMLSSREARKSRNEYEKYFKNDPSLIQKLSRSGISAKELAELEENGAGNALEAYQIWESGSLLHDMRIAADHSKHVVKSVKQLGVANHHWSPDVNVNQSLHEALTILKSYSKDINLKLDFSQVPAIYACTGELTQVWINLIKNAIESLRSSNTANPELHIETSETGNHIQIRISDNGPGIPEKILKKIFEPSFTTKVGGLNFGLGLGLSITQRIIEAHNGEIKVSSKPGKTSFILLLPKNS